MFSTINHFHCEKRKEAIIQWRDPSIKNRTEKLCSSSSQSDTTPLVNNAIKKGSFKEEDPDAKEVAPGFKVQDGESKVKVESSAIEAAAPANECPVDGEVHPGPYDSKVAAK